MNLDIIIPCYNARDTIERTLLSIAIQKYTKGLNVYLINDCSDYNYFEYVEFFKNYFNIIEIDLQKNVGPGSARQIGIESSKSKYIMFIDSDDYLYNPLVLKKIYNDINNTKSDILSSLFFCEY